MAESEEPEKSEPQLPYIGRRKRARIKKRTVEDIRDRRIDLLAALRDADLETKWRCDWFASDGFLTVLAGLGGEGKSWWVHALTSGVLTGSKIAGLQCEQGDVIMFDAENGQKLIGKRLRLAQTPKLGNLAIYESDGLDLMRADDQEAVLKMLLEDQPQMIIFDSLRTLAPSAEENSSDDMSVLMAYFRAVARQTQAAIILNHHRDKTGSMDYRGSGAIRDQTDLMFTLSRDDSDPMGKHRRCLRCVKNRIDEEPDDRWYTFKKHRGLMSFMEAAPFEGERPQSTTGAKQERMNAILEHLGGDPETAAEINQALGLDRTDGTTRRALDELVRFGDVTKDNSAKTYRVKQ